MYSIEHILPENPNDGWDTFPDDAVERLVYRLGNLTLLETNVNRTIGNESYETKKQAYAGSSLGITKAIPQHYTVWDEDKVNQRQNRLAIEANSIWRLQFN